jgi:hypothetical protein
MNSCKTGAWFFAISPNIGGSKYFHHKCGGFFGINLMSTAFVLEGYQEVTLPIRLSLLLSPSPSLPDLSLIPSLSLNQRAEQKENVSG